MVINYYISGPFCTVWCCVNNDYIILNTAPITRKFIGQKLSDLTKWMKADKIVKLNA